MFARGRARGKSQSVNSHASNDRIFVPIRSVDVAEILIKLALTRFRPLQAISVLMILQILNLASVSFIATAARCPACALAWCERDVGCPPSRSNRHPLDSTQKSMGSCAGRRRSETHPPIRPSAAASSKQDMTDVRSPSQLHLSNPLFQPHFLILHR